MSTPRSSPVSPSSETKKGAGMAPYTMEASASKTPITASKSVQKVGVLRKREVKGGELTQKEFSTGNLLFKIINVYQPITLENASNFCFAFCRRHYDG
jgi:hypothetical protein